MVPLLIFGAFGVVTGHPDPVPRLLARLTDGPRAPVDGFLAALLGGVIVRGSVLTMTLGPQPVPDTA